MTKKYIFLIVFAGFLVYANTLKNPFVWDDGLFIQNGNFIKKFENISVFFSPKNYFKYTQDFTYRPLPFLVHIINYKICGVNPVCHRLTNIFLHITVGILLYFLILELLKNNLVAFLSGFFFVLHPVNTEVVNMVSFVETQLSTIFFLATFLCYVKLKNFLSFIFFFIAVFCKETVIVLPAVIILYDLVFEKKIQVKKYLPFLIVGMFYLVVRFFIFRHPQEAILKYPSDNFLINIFTTLKLIPTYLRLVFYPINLSMEYKTIIPQLFFERNVIFGFLAILFFLTILIYSYKKSLSDGYTKISQTGKIIFFWLLFTVITFLPTSNIIPMQNIIAERYLYLPIIGFCVLISLLLKKIGERYPNVCYCVAFCIFLFFTTAIIIRNFDWKSDFIFYSKTLEQVPNSPSMNATVGLVYAKYKNYPKAFEYVHKALKLNPKLPDGYGALASIYQDTKDYDMALGLYERAVVEKKYTYHKAPFLSIGVIYKIKKQYQKAIENFNRAIEINPLSSLAYTYLAEIYEMHGDVDKTEKFYKKSVDINPDDYIPLNALGIIYGQKGNYNKSLKYLKKAVKLKSNSVDVHFNIGYVYFLSYRYGEALREMKKTLKLEPNHENAKIVISQILGKKQ
ncbi:MAG: tetratricopeptide repeat protein [Elusimicrobiota bacterium]